MSNLSHNSENSAADVRTEQPVAISLAHQSFSGPLPHPSILQQYNAIQPDFAERILALTESETAHRHNTLRCAMRFNALETFIGQIFGLIVALAGFATTAWLGQVDQATASSIVGGSTILGLVTVFVTGRQSKQTAPNQTGE